MVTITLRPAGGGALTEWSAQYPSSGYHFDKVDEAVTDEDSTYIYLGSSSYKADLFRHSGYTASGDITAIRVYARGCNVVGGSSYSYWKGAVRTGGTTYYGTEVVYATTIAYTTMNWEWTTNPNTGLAWRWSDLELLEFGIAARNGTGGNTTRCTQVYIEVDYTPDSAGANVFSGAFF